MFNDGVVVFNDGMVVFSDGVFNVGDVRTAAFWMIAAGDRHPSTIEVWLDAVGLAGAGLDTISGCVDPGATTTGRRGGNVTELFGGSVTGFAGGNVTVFAGGSVTEFAGGGVTVFEPGNVEVTVAVGTFDTMPGVAICGEADC